MKFAVRARSSVFAVVLLLNTLRLHCCGTITEHLASASSAMYDIIGPTLGRNSYDKSEGVNDMKEQSHALLCYTTCSAADFPITIRQVCIKRHICCTCLLVTLRTAATDAITLHV